jgi:chromosome segregation ATPase
MRKEYDKKYTELQKDTEIKLKETEMTTLIHPYKKDIEQLELHLEEERELLKSGKKSKLSPALNGYDEVDMTPSDVENTNNRIEFLKREIARNEYEINRIKEGYLEEIEEIKEKYNSMSEYN